MTFDLSGRWELFAISPGHTEITRPEQLNGLNPIPGSVPGNLELDLVSAGMAEDPFLAENVRAYRTFEFYDFWYRKEFAVPPEFTGKCELVFDGVDCFAEFFLNEEKIGESGNALIPHRFRADILPKNELAVRIIATEIATRCFPDEPAAIAHMPQVYGTLYTRKPAHASGWDIAPRLQLGGLWKGVRLEKQTSDFRFTDVWLQTLRLDPENNSAQMRLFYSFNAGRRSLEDFTLKFSGICGESHFELEEPAYFTSGTVDFSLPHPELWNPRGYGLPNLYDLHAILLDENKSQVAEYSSHFGVRTVDLERTELNIGGSGKFAIRINGITVRALGSNHVPFDALHSRDAERLEKVLALFDELQCNMIRCWGGGVYEPEEFYDFCDRHGILVWQDFMFGCAVYPQNREFFDLVRPEAEQVVRRLRKHASLALWCGDNECDQFYVAYGAPVESNALNRKFLPDIVSRLDPSRPYLPSSPFVPTEAQKYGKAVWELLPERHLWGARETFKLPFYYASKAKFISETGWHGCPNLSSLQKFLSPEHFRYDDCDPEWDLHASNPFLHGSYMETRSQLIGKQLMEYFGRKPETLEDYAQYSQIFQAEALKFMVETARLDPECNGILWWNVIDCWPQFSDSIVDYYFGKKLAFHYLKRIQSPFCLLCSEPDPWNSEVIAVNDSCEPAEGTFTVETEQGIALSGAFKAAPFSRKTLCSLRSPRGVNELWLLRWRNGSADGANHYISGNLLMDSRWYLDRLSRIAALDGAFDASQLAQ